MSRRALPSVPTLMVALLASAALAPSAARASAFASADIGYDNALLSNFNLVTLGNLTQSSASGAAIAGRAIVGGNATFAGNTASVCASCGGNAPVAVDSSKATFGALTVFGNLVTPTTNSSGGNAYLNVGAGDVAVKGTSSGNVLLNGGGAYKIAGSASGTNIGNAGSIKTTQSSFAGGNYTYSTSTGQVTGYGPTPQVNQTLASVFPFSTSYQTQAKSLAQGLANLPGSPNVTTQKLTTANGNGIFFTAANDYVNGGKKYGVITTTVADLAAMTSFKGVDNGSNDATFVIVTGDGASLTLPNLNSYAGASKVIFDFVDATTLKFGGSWSGSILAPLANITMGTGAFDGSVIVASINQSQALTATNLFNGDLSGLVPEPASIAVFGAGVAALGWVRRRRRR